MNSRHTNSRHFATEHSDFPPSVDLKLKSTQDTVDTCSGYSTLWLAVDLQSSRAVRLQSRDVLAKPVKEGLTFEGKVHVPWGDKGIQVLLTELEFLDIKEKLGVTSPIWLPKATYNVKAKIATAYCRGLELQRSVNSVRNSYLMEKDI